MHFQKSLPRLAIPKFEQTIERYLASQKPLLLPAEFEKTKSIAERFLTGEGNGKYIRQYSFTLNNNIYTFC